MANAAFHFATGMTAGMAVLTPMLGRYWRTGHRLASAVTRWLLISWGAGVWAITPSLLRYAGLPETCSDSGWMNLFILHPLINQRGPHATLVGAALLVGVFIIQYTVILAAVFRARQR